jgi:hypothetical protein
MKRIVPFVAGCLCIMACNNHTANQAGTKDSTAMAAAAPKMPPQAEFADQKYVDLGKKANALFEKGDMDAWLDQFSDSAVYRWSGGDSLIGKAAIVKYWKDRRANVIDSIHFENDIWLPIKVNQPQKGPDVAGIWLLGWEQPFVKYKNGKKITFWIHTDSHYDKNDKVDILIQYIDRAPINAALKKS